MHITVDTALHPAHNTEKHTAHCTCTPPCTLHCTQYCTIWRCTRRTHGRTGSWGPVEQLQYQLVAGTALHSLGTGALSRYWSILSVLEHSLATPHRRFLYSCSAAYCTLSVCTVMHSEGPVSDLSST